jgi:hypothetical protein
MSDPETKLNRLFQAARSAPPEEIQAPMPAHLKTRVLAHWRSEEAQVSGWLSLASLFRRALACATLAMLVCLVWSYMDVDMGNADPNVVEIASGQDDDAVATIEVPAELMP